MRATVAAAAALTLMAMAATTASAGVVISQDVVLTNRAGERKSEQTVMIQGNKEKIVSAERAIIIDLDAGKIDVLFMSRKKFAQLDIPPPGTTATLFAQDGMFLQYAKGSGTGKEGGQECQNWVGVGNAGRLKLEASECVASTAPGAAEFVAFRKALAEKLKKSPLEGKGETPDGIPMNSTLTVSFIPFPIPSSFPPEQAAKIRELAAQRKPSVRTIKVTKIEVKDLPAETFAVPADFAKPTLLPMPSAKPAAAPH